MPPYIYIYIYILYIYIPTYIYIYIRSICEQQLFRFLRSLLRSQLRSNEDLEKPEC